MDYAPMEVKTRIPSGYTVKQPEGISTLAIIEIDDRRYFDAQNTPALFAEFNNTGITSLVVDLTGISDIRVRKAVGVRLRDSIDRYGFLVKYVGVDLDGVKSKKTLAAFRNKTAPNLETAVRELTN